MKIKTTAIAALLIPLLFTMCKSEYTLHSKLVKKSGLPYDKKWEVELVNNSKYVNSYIMLFMNNKIANLNKRLRLKLSATDLEKVYYIPSVHYLMDSAALSNYGTMSSPAGSLKLAKNEVSYYGILNNTYILGASLRKTTDNSWTVYDMGAPSSTYYSDDIISTILTTNKYPAINIQINAGAGRRKRIFIAYINNEHKMIDFITMKDLHLSIKEYYNRIYNKQK
jgi:hypothetical protein